MKVETSKRLSGQLRGVPRNRRNTAIQEIGRHVLARGGKLRAPLSVSIELTTQCNRSCVFCVQAFDHLLGARPVRHFDSESLAALAGQLADMGVVAVEFTGGEPSYHPDIVTAIGCFKKLRIGVAVQTDGSNLSPELIARLGEILEPHDKILFSLDAATPDTQRFLRGDANFDRTVFRLEALGREQFQLETRTVIVKANYAEAGRILDLARAAGAQKSTLSLPYKHESIAADIHVSPREYLALYDYFADEPGIAFNSLNVTGASGLWDSPERAESIPGRETACPAGHTSCYVDVTGNVSTCQYALDDKKAVIGNVFDSSFAEIWDRINCRVTSGQLCSAGIVNGPAEPERLS